MKNQFLILAGICLVMFTSCLDTSNDVDAWEGTFTYNFTTMGNVGNWSGMNANYPEASYADYDFSYGFNTIDKTKKGVKLQAKNVGSDSLFQFMKIRETGLKANTTYEFAYRFSMLSLLPDNGPDSKDPKPTKEMYVKVGVFKEGIGVKKNSEGIIVPTFAMGGLKNQTSNVKVLGPARLPQNPQTYYPLVGNSSIIEATSNASGEINFMLGYTTNIRRKIGVQVTAIQVLFKKKK